MSKILGTMFLLCMLLIGAAAGVPAPVTIGASSTDGVNIVSTTTSITGSGSISGTATATNSNGLLDAQMNTQATSSTSIKATATVDPTFAGTTPLAGFVADATGPASVMNTNLVAEYQPTGQTGIAQNFGTTASGSHVDLTETAAGDAWNDNGASTAIVADGAASISSSTGVASSSKTSVQPQVSATTTVSGTTATSNTQSWDAGYVNPSQSSYVWDVAQANANENGGSMTVGVAASVDQNTATSHAGQVSQTVSVPFATNAGATTTATDKVNGYNAAVTAQMGAGTMNIVQSASYSVAVTGPVSGLFTKTTDLLATQGTIATGPTYGPVTIGTNGIPTTGFTAADATAGAAHSNVNINNGVLLGSTISTVEQAHVTQTATTTTYTIPYTQTGVVTTAIQPVATVTA